MNDMTRRERIMTATRKEGADKLPFFHYWRHCDFGWAERTCRNRGMGINWERPSYTVNMHGVEITETRSVVSGETVIRKTYKTPAGSIYVDEKWAPGTGQWKAMRGWQDITAWQTDRLIKGPEDYKVLQYIAENTEYCADYFPIQQAMEWLGEEGVVIDYLPHSPMQMLMIDWVGSEKGRFFYHHADYPDLVEETYRAISKSREPLYEIVAKSPSPICRSGDNIDGLLVNPILFEKYFMPEYEKQAAVFHRHGKLLAVHMDGRLNILKDLINRTPIDIIEGFHPPPMGDLPLGEALSLWKEKVIWMGFPGAIYSLGPETTRRYAIDLLAEIGTGHRLAVAMSTENLVSNDNLLAVTSVLEKAALPLGADIIERIEGRKT